MQGEAMERSIIKQWVLSLAWGVAMVVQGGTVAAIASPLEPLATSHPNPPAMPGSASVLLAETPATSGDPAATEPETTEIDPAAIEIDPAIVEQSPVLQRWLQEIPNVLAEIRRDPSFRTRLRLGYSQFPANEQAAGFNVGVEDAFIARTGLTVSADYQATFNGDREAYGANLRYYVLPLGSYVNLAPVVGYRYIDTDRYTTDGVNLGVRLLLIPSRTGAADISLTQSWVAPGTDEEVGITTLSLGYALTHNLRLSTDLEKQNAPQRKDSRVAIVVEWMP